MSLQNCPKCQNNSFTWKIDEEISQFTIWECTICNYQVFEDESLLTVCDSCKTKTKSYIIDNDKKFWWCSNCNSTEINI